MNDTSVVVENAPAMPAGPASMKSPTDLLREAWQIFTEKWKTIIAVQIIPGLLSLAMGIAVALGLFGSVAMGGRFDFSTLVGGGLVLLIFGLIAAVVQFWAQVATLYVVAKHSESVGWMEAYGRVKSLLLRYFWLSLLSGLITAAGFILFFIPGIILGVWFSLAVYVFLDRGIGGLNALATSKEYVKGYWWPVFGRYAFLFLVVIVTYIVVSIPMGIISGQAQEEAGLMGPFISLLSNVVGMVFAGVSIIYTYLMYDNLKQLKGELTVAPSPGEKLTYYGLATLSVLLVVALIGVMMFSIAILGPQWSELMRRGGQPEGMQEFQQQLNQMEQEQQQMLEQMQEDQEMTEQEQEMLRDVIERGVQDYDEAPAQ